MKIKRTQTDHGKTGGQAKKRWFYIGYSLILATVVLIILLYIAENKAEKSLLELMNKELAPNAEIIIDNFSLSIFPIGVSIKGVHLLRHHSPDDVTALKPGDAIQHLSIDEIALSGVRISSLIKRDHFHARRFTLKGVEFEFIQPKSEDKSDNEPGRDLIPITLSDIQFTDLNLMLFDHPASDSASTSIQNLSGRIKEFFLSDPSEPAGIIFEKLELTADHFSHFTENGFYKTSLDSFQLDTDDELLMLRHFNVIPLKSAREMAIELGYPIDNYDLQIPKLKIDRVDLNRWITKGEIIAGVITLTEPAFIINRDNSLPRREKEDRVLPHIQFKHLPFPVGIDTIRAEKGFLRYIEEISEEDRSGAISFTEIDLTLSSLINRSTTPIFAEATALFMDQSDFDLSVEFSMDDDGSHTVSGNLYQLDLTSMNSTLENLALISLKTGELHQLNFRFQGDDDRSAGDLILIYSDLDIRFIDMEEQRERRRDRIRSFIANTFLIRSDNPAEDPRIGEVEYERDKERSIFNFWLRSISSGLIDTIKR